MGSPSRMQFPFGLLLDLVRRWTGRSDGGRARHRAGPHGRQRFPWSGRPASKRFTYEALVMLLPQQADGGEAVLPGPVCRAVVRARHRQTHRSKLFSALVTTGDGGQPRGKSAVVTMVVVGEDPGSYLAPGEHFALLRGCDVARGTVTRRVFV